MSAGAFKDAGIPNGEVSLYRGLVDGSEMGTGEVRVEHATEDSQRCYRQQTSIELVGGAKYEVATVFARRDGLIFPERYESETFYRDRPVAAERGHFRDVCGLNWTGSVEPYPEHIMPLLGCAVGLRGLDFVPHRKRRFSCWLANTLYWDVVTRVDQLDELDLPVGRIEAWRVSAWPSFEFVVGRAQPLLQLVMPSFTLHFEKHPPHRFLRLRVPAGPLHWNPESLIEAVDLGPR